MTQRSSNEPHAEVEALLTQHPKIRECAVTRIQTRPGHEELVAYIITSETVGPAELRSFLSAPRLGSRRIPRAFVPVGSLPRTANGELDVAALPHPVTVTPSTGGKGGPTYGYPSEFWDRRSENAVVGMVVTALLVALAAFLLTDTLWPYSTDRSAVPQPWSGLFLVLYVCECLAFGLGIGFLLFGRPLVRANGRSRPLTAITHLAIAWSSAAWWPQDNFYRLAAKTDWPRQAALVYVFNVSLMVAAAVIIVFAAARPADPR